MFRRSDLHNKDEIKHKIVIALFDGESKDLRLGLDKRKQTVAFCLICCICQKGELGRERKETL